MPSVIFDYTRVSSALGHSSGRPGLILENLSKVVEGIVLCDSIFTTESTSLESMGRTLVDGKGFCDLSKTYIYEPIFDKIFKRVPPDVDARVGRAHHRLPREDYHGGNWLAADVAVLDEAKALARGEDFQFLFRKRFFGDGPARLTGTGSAAYSHRGRDWGPIRSGPISHSFSQHNHARELGQRTSWSFSSV